MAMDKKARDALMEQLANLDDAKLAQEVHRIAENEVGQYGSTVVNAREESLKTELASYKKIYGYDDVVMNFAKNQAAVTGNFDKTGYTGTSTQVQQQIPFPEKAGAVWVKGKLNVSENGQLSGETGFNYVGPASTHKLPGTETRVDAVPIASVDVNIPNTGKVKAENVNVLGGVVVKGHETDGKTHNANHTLAVIGNTKGVDGLYRVSKQYDIDDKHALTSYVVGTYGSSGKASVGVGSQFNKDLGHGYGASLQAEATVADVTGNPAVGGMLTGRFTWGGSEEKSAPEAQVSSPAELSNKSSQSKTQLTQAGAGHGVSTSTSTQQPVTVNEKLLEQKIDKLMTSNNYADGMQ